MAVVFSIPGTDRRFTYPEHLGDVTFDQFLHYMEVIAPDEPAHLRTLRQSYIDEDEANRESLRQADRFRVKHDGSGGPELMGRILEKVRGEAARNELIALQKRMDSAVRKREDAARSITDLYYATNVLPYFSRVVAYFTGVDVDTITGADGTPMDRGDVEGLYWQIIKALDTAPGEWSGSRRIEFDGDEYELPERFMTNGTVIEFMEAAQFQQSMNDLKNGYWKSLIDVVSVILRKPGEKYSEEVFERNRAKFPKMPMDKIVDIGFFLRRRNEMSVSDFRTYTAGQSLTKLKQELTN